MAAGRVSENPMESCFDNFVCLFVCLFAFRACIIIGGCFVLSGSAIISKAVYMLVIDNEPKRVRNDVHQQS